jgi:hypothetical protein
VHTRLAANAIVRVNLHYPVGALAKRRSRANIHARRFFTLITAQNRETPANRRELALLGVLNPGTKTPERHIVLGFASNGAGVTANAARVVDDKS